MIIVPAAGNGRRFQEAGYPLPKHELQIGGKRMVDRVVENVQHLDVGGEVVIATRDMVGETRGAVETVLRALEKSKPQPFERVVIANCDQLINWAQPFGVSDAWDGWLVVFASQENAHSYVKVTDAGRVRAIVEKQVVSQLAVSGVYVFKSAARLQDALGNALLAAGDEEVYLSDAIEYLLWEDAWIQAIPRPTAILGTPEDFQRFQTAYAVAHQEALRGACC